MAGRKSVVSKIAKKAATVSDKDTKGVSEDLTIAESLLEPTPKVTAKTRKPRAPRAKQAPAATTASTESNASAVADSAAQENSTVSATPTASTASTASPVTPQFYCALALPLGNMGYQARVAGLALLVPAKRADAQLLPSLSKAQRKVLEGTGQAQLLSCQLAPHTQLSPHFLWQQGIDPYNLQHGLSAAEFLAISSFCLQPTSDQDVLVSFALRHFVACHTMALQNYMRPNFLTRFNYIVDIRVALFTCAYFGQQRDFWQHVPRHTWGNLVQAATALGFDFQACDKASNTQATADAPTPLNSATTDHGGVDAVAALPSSGSESISSESTPAHLQQRHKVTALSYIYRYLWQLEPKIMSFVQRSWLQRLKFVTQHRYMVSLDAKDQICVLAVLAYDLNLRLLKAISCNGNDLQVVVLSLDTAPLLAPTSILTPERQQELNFDLTAVMAKLSQVDLGQLGLDPWPLSADALESKYTPFAHGNTKVADAPRVMGTKATSVLTAQRQQDLYEITARLSRGEDRASFDAISTDSSATTSSHTSIMVDYANQAAMALADVPPPQGVVSQAMGVFTESDLPFYQRYWLSIAAGHEQEWWALAQLLESAIKVNPEMTLRLWSLLQPQTTEANAWGLQALGYGYENVQSLLDESLLQRYRHYVTQLALKRSKTWQQELQLLYNSLAKDDRYGAQLLTKIASFLGMA